MNITVADHKQEILNKLNVYLNSNKSKFKQKSKKNNYGDLIFNLISVLSNNPLLNYYEIAKILNISLDELKDLNSIVREVDFFQKLIIHNGLGTKYWKNMIIPLINSKSIFNFLDKKYLFPFRVGLYPGVSCMFECTFCGRNYNAKYQRNALEKGIETFKKLIDEAPNNDRNRFYISGGLEPLTNPKLGQIINHLKEKNFNSAMYTNGYMLTQKYFDKNPEIFDLDSLRISFYGIDSEQYFKVTRKNRAFEIVTDNIETYLKKKFIKKSKTSFGLNFVILKGREKDLVELSKLLIDINKKLNFQNLNNFNFLTLREDFSIYGERMNLKQRTVLSKSIKEFEELISNSGYLNDLFVDYGFALEPLRNGILTEKFENIFVSVKDLEDFGVPQASVSVDLYGDVYLYREAAFLDRPGAKRYIIGNLIKEGSMENVVKNFMNKKKDIKILDSDRDYLDTWDHITIKLSQQLKKNREMGFPINKSAINIDTINKLLNYRHQVHFAEKS
jgi:dTDP-4-amino-4,6-dideoxy-D-glucose ammonia-lyase